MEDEDFLAAVEADNTSTPVEEKAAETPPDPKPDDTPPPPIAADADVLELDTPAPVETATDPAKPQEGFVPISALLDERDKRKAAEAKLVPVAPPPPVQRPDEYEDPEGARAFDQAQVGGALYQINLRYSERLAKVEHGAETVQAAKDWGLQKCDTDPFFNAKVAASEDPIGFVVAEYKREEIASKVDLSDWEQFQAWKTAQGQLQEQPGAVPTTPSAPSIPPKSIASAPSAGGILNEVAQSDEEIFAEVLPKG